MTGTLYDFDLKRGVLWVRHGKGDKQRVVPLGERAIAWLEKYLTEARPQLAIDDNPALFLNDYGEPVTRPYVADKVKRYMEFAGVHKVGSTHLMRHACATHMLEGGADIRFIQEMLGHSNLQTTEIYTHVSMNNWNNWGQSKLKFLLSCLMFPSLTSVKPDGKITQSMSDRDSPACDPARK